MKLAKKIFLAILDILNMKPERIQPDGKDDGDKTATRAEPTDCAES